jgi:hypothetical protein
MKVMSTAGFATKLILSLSVSLHTAKPNKLGIAEQQCNSRILNNLQGDDLSQINLEQGGAL